MTANQKKDILPIEDDADNCLFFGQAMTKVSKNIRGSQLESTDQLFKAIKNNRLSLIVADLHLRQKRGMEYLKQIRSHLEFNAISAGYVEHFLCGRPCTYGLSGRSTAFFEKPWPL